MKFNFYHIVFFSSIVLATQYCRAAETIKPNTYLQKVVKTAKERLGKKYSDNQRVNNCKVPIAKKGSKPRPDQCHKIKH